jgi:CDP-diacylglycerol--serine O-phosphatidyltransferase
MSLTSVTLGCLSILQSVSFSFTKAAIFAGVAAILDFFDGFVARQLKAQSALGKELDSLCDLVSFGVAPAFCMYYLAEYRFEHHLANYSAFLLVIFAAIRLARFNLDDSQSDHFIGLPTPAMAMVAFSMYFVLEGFPLNWSGNTGLAMLVSINVALAALMIAPIHLFSLKFKTFDFAGNKYRYGFLVMAIGLLALLQAVAVPVIIFLYILMSLLMRKQLMS